MLLVANRRAHGSYCVKLGRSRSRFASRRSPGPLTYGELASPEARQLNPMDGPILRRRLGEGPSDRYLPRTLGASPPLPSVCMARPWNWRSGHGERYTLPIGRPSLYRLGTEEVRPWLGGHCWMTGCLERNLLKFLTRGWNALYRWPIGSASKR